MLTIRRLMTALATGLVALGAASAADAATVEVKNGAVVYDVDIQNPFAQDLLMEFKDGRYVFTERGNEPRAALNPGTSCRKDDGKVMSCEGTGVTRAVIELENLDDVVEVGTGVSVPVSFSMGQGGDQATGGPGGDTFLGGVVGIGNDTFEGKGGNDTFQSGTGADVMKGGEGLDTFDLSARVPRQTVALDGEPNDGDPTDVASLSDIALTGADNALEIENIIGGSARDTLTGNDVANAIDGRGSEDTIEGRLGADALVGGNGNDTILARGSANGVPDPDAVISCGGGQDTVKADAEDGPVIAADCEDIDCGNCDLPPAGSPPGTPPVSPPIAALDPPGGANDADEGAGAGGGGGTQAPDVQIVSGGVVPLKANGRIPVRIVCIYRADRCKGSLTLKAKAKISVKIRGRTKTFAKNAVIAKADLTPIRWGNSEPVQLKANALFRAILPLLRKPNVKVTALLESQDTAGGANAPTARATGDLVVAAKGKRK